MCMIDVEEVKTKKPKFGWKVIEKYFDGFHTPYEGMKIAKGKTYHTEYKEHKGFYIFLDKSDAIRFKNWLAFRHEIYRFNLARVRLGNHIWKGDIDSHDGFTDLKIEHFYTTDMIEVLDIEE